MATVCGPGGANRYAASWGGGGISRNDGGGWGEKTGEPLCRQMSTYNTRRGRLRQIGQGPSKNQGPEEKSDKKGEREKDETKLFTS